MKIWIVVVILVAFISLYALWIRDWLKTKPWAQGFFAWIEPIEILLYKKSETILFARLKIFIGLLLSALTTLGAIDLSPIMPFVPDKYAFLAHAAVNMLPLAITIVGLIDEKLRNSTTKPIELVAIPDKVVAANPQIAETIATADATNIVAVAAITEAKANGHV